MSNPGTPEWRAAMEDARPIEDAAVEARPGEFLSIGKAAELLGVDRSSVYGWIRRKKIPAWRTPGGRIRVKRSTLLQLVEETAEIPDPGDLGDPGRPE